MDESLRMFNLVESHYSGKKSHVLDIGAMSCSLINQFLINGYTNLTAIDKSPISIYACFITYKISNNQITKYDQVYILHDREDKTISINNTDTIINNLYSHELGEYIDSVNLCSGNRGDFFTFQPIEKFNIILSSFIFHFYPPSEDINIINRLKNISGINSIIYIKVHNLKRIETANKSFIRDGLTVRKDNDVWYLFNNERLDFYKNNFETIYENISGDVSELLLINKTK